MTVEHPGGNGTAGSVHTGMNSHTGCSTPGANGAVTFTHLSAKSICHEKKNMK